MTAVLHLIRPSVRTGAPSPPGEGNADAPFKEKAISPRRGLIRWLTLNQTNNPKLKRSAQTLRREMTREERHLWYDFLKRLPVTVNRQKVIGHYIVDFYCASAKLVIELDGSQHFEESGAASDRSRDNALEQLGITVVRYSNEEINRNFDGVCADLLRRLDLESIEQASP